MYSICHGLISGPSVMKQEKCHKAQQPPTDDSGTDKFVNDNFYTMPSPTFTPNSEMIEMTKAAIKQLEKKFDDLVSCTRRYMVTTHVDVQDLLQSITRLPGDLKSEHDLFIEK